MNGGASQAARVLAATDAAMRPRFQSPLARIAMEEFTTRRQALQQAARSGRRPASSCENMARCWLAIAFAAGARPPEADGFFFADHIADRADWQAELARARDAAVAKALAHPTDREFSARAMWLSSLALHLGIAFPQQQMEPA